MNERNAQYFLDLNSSCVSSTDATAKTVIRKTARLASYYNSKWWVVANDNYD